MGLAILRNLMVKKNPGAYRGKLTCPVCHSEAMKYLEEVCLGRSRYRCRKCGMKSQYDWSNSPYDTHPYAAWNTSKYQRIVKLHSQGKSMTLRKGGQLSGNGESTGAKGV